MAKDKGEKKSSSKSKTELDREKISAENENIDGANKVSDTKSTKKEQKKSPHKEAAVSAKKQTPSAKKKDELTLSPDGSQEKKANGKRNAGNTASKKVAKQKKETDSGQSDEDTVKNLFAAVPEKDEISRITPIEDIDDSLSDDIEAAAIAALPRTEVNPELLIDDLGSEDTHESAEESQKYEAFLADYKEIMARMLRDAQSDEIREIRANKRARGSDDDDISRFIVTDEDFFDDDDEELYQEEEYLTPDEIGLTDEDIAKFADDKKTPDDSSDSVQSEQELSDTSDEPLAKEAVDDGYEISIEEIISEENVQDATDTANGSSAPSEEAEAKEDGTDESSESKVPLFSESKELNNECENSEASDEKTNENTESCTEIIDEEVDTEESFNESAESCTEIINEEAYAENSGEDMLADAESVGDTAQQTAKAESEAAEIGTGKDNFPDISLREYIPGYAEEIFGTDIPSDENERCDEKEAEEEEEDDGYAGLDQLEMSFGEEESEEDEKDEEEEKYSPDKPRFIDKVFELVELITYTFVAIMIITSFFIRHSVVEGRSMQNTLQNRDIVLISDFLYTPERGDIVVLEDYTVSSAPLIKRVIGIAGDTVEITPSGVVYVNGEILDEPYVHLSFGWNVNAGIYTVGEGELFVLGDHRNISEDSEDFGPVNAESVIGKVLFRLFPFESFGALE